MTIAERPWWKDAVVYQIYPASFKDSNNDGIGDFVGIIESLDYIQSIGVDVIWICPMYNSPQVDMGYDISDYEDVYPPYGTLKDMEVLISEVHKRGMRIILDLVINHTSDQHKWFQESRSSKDNPKRNWYIWKPAKYDAEGRRQPPNNWRSVFGGSVWEWDEQTQEYYLHLFCTEQPDLNWENEETRKAIYQSAMIFWLERGVDGFRVDTVNMYSKDPSYRDAPITDPAATVQQASDLYCNGPRMNEFLSEMNTILSRYNAMTVGECPHTDNVDTVIGYVSAKQKRLNMVFQFDVVDVGKGSVFRYQTEPFAYTLRDFKHAVARTQTLLAGTDAWTTAFVENHDQARSVSRFGDDSLRWRERSAKMLALLFAALSGTLFIYEGQEIGMINMPKDWPIEEYKDVESMNYYRMVADRTNNDPAELTKAHTALQYLARDHARTPMQWNSSKNGGFTADDVEPWMRVNSSTAHINVANQTVDKDSVLAFWRHMLQVRKTYNDLFVHGDFELLDAENNKVFTFVKHGQRGGHAVVVCNFSTGRSQVPSGLGLDKSQFLTGNVTQQVANGARDLLEPWEGRIYLLEREM